MENGDNISPKDKEKNMQNPFESGHIKNYLLLYASVVVIMVLFFIASTLFNDVQDFEKKIFNTQMPEVTENLQETKVQEEEEPKFKLLPKVY